MSLAITIPQGAAPSNIVMLQIGDIEPWAMNPRKTFDQEELDRLVNSIQLQGVLQNIVVRRLRPEINEGEQNFRYQVIAGERRWRACKIAGLESIPARILSDMTTDAFAFELAFRENIDRQSLAPLDEAEGYSQMLMLSHSKQEDLAKMLGISQSAISNSLRLLRLPDAVQEEIRKGRLSKAVALVLCRLSDHPADCGEIAFSAAEEGFTQRQVEKLVEARLGNIQKAERERQGQMPLPLDPVQTVPEVATETATVETAENDSDPDAQPVTPVVPAEERFQDEDMEDPFAGDVETVTDEEDTDAGDATAAEDAETEQQAETPEAAPTPAGAAAPVVDAAVPPVATPQAVTPATPAASPAAKPAAPTETVTAPAGPMIATSISQATDDWLFEEDLTLDQALEELKKYRLTTLTKTAVEALTDFYNKTSDEQISISDYLEAVLVARAQKAGLMGGDEREV